MKKIKMGADTMMYPMPAALVGARGRDGRITFSAIAWAGIVNSTPPMVGAGIRKSRFTHELISETGVFSVNVPSAKQAVETDFCGIRSGRDVDKVKACKFTVFYGSLENAPLIEECPVNMECTVEKVVELPSHDYFIGKIVESHMDENLKVRRGDKFFKLDPLVFMGTHYCRTTDNLGKAFSVGRRIKS
jgi:flavin reductase (DIM6/NTAB) family NADH-FMN oxidoreductase RutF